MLIQYLSSPNTQQQAHAARGMPVLLSFAVAALRESSWLTRYLLSFDRILIDSGAFSTLNSGKVIDNEEYGEWSKRMMEMGNVDACACLDSIVGDWKQGIANWHANPHTFPVFHDTDPPRALDEILEALPGRPQWIGLGMKPPRTATRWLDETLTRIENERPGLHVHTFAGRKFLRRLTRHRGRSVSTDSTNWMLDVAQILQNPLTRHLTPAEALDIIVKRYQRYKITTAREETRDANDLQDLPLFSSSQPEWLGP